MFLFYVHRIEKSRSLKRAFPCFDSGVDLVFGKIGNDGSVDFDRSAIGLSIPMMWRSKTLLPNAGSAENHKDSPFRTRDEALENSILP